MNLNELLHERNETIELVVVGGAISRVGCVRPKKRGRYPFISLLL